ncbi:MAG: hypothetical protein ACRDPM_22605 [Solirubrobacteraceae bacterium]
MLAAAFSDPGATRPLPVEHRIAAGELTAAEVILGSRWEIESTQIGAVLISQHVWGALAVDRTGRVHLEDLRDLQRNGASHWHEPPTNRDIGAIRSETAGPRSEVVPRGVELEVAVLPPSSAAVGSV